MKKRILFLLSFSVLALCSCGGGTQVSGTVDAEDGAVVTIGAPTGSTVSDRLLGFNIVYAKNPDAVWESGELAKAIKACRPGLLRYPGGTVNTYFHWNDPSGYGWEDLWNPEFKDHRLPESEYMDIDEYFNLLDETGAEPLLGVNCCSGFVWDRLDESLQEAIALMQYCKDHGRKVKYWYLGNEPYMKGCNGGPYTIAEYAEHINTFVPVMKAFDPDIKIAVNWHATFRKHGDQYRELLSLAGDNIDIVDIHQYNMWGDASWSAWQKNEKCGSFLGDSYESEVGAFRKIAAECGYPEIELATLEWNVGPGKNSQEQKLTAAQSALVQSEMLIQFIRGGMDIATFWPLFWDSEFAFRSFFDKKAGVPLPIAAIMPLFGQFQGAELLSCDVEGFKVQAVAVKDGRTTRLCILNKNAEARRVSLPSVKGRVVKESFVYDADRDSLLNSKSKTRLDGMIELPAFSLVFLTF